MDLRFARNTAVMLHMLPHWFKERKGSADSIGARYLNVSGLKLDDLRYVIKYAYQQCYIGTADIEYADFCYKAIIPMGVDVSKLESVFGYGKKIKKAGSLKEFFGIDQNIRTKDLNTLDTYFADAKRNIIYVRRKYNVDAVYPNGSIKYTYGKKTYTQELIPHHVWNFFDEFGLLLCTPRLPEEPNILYKERLLDVFRNPANASRDGLVNGIARELGLRRNRVWADPKQDLELTDSMVILNSIKVNGEFFPLERIFITEAGTVLLKGNLDYELLDEKGKRKPDVWISYAHGFEMHKLWNRDDIKLWNELFTIDHKPKYALEKYIALLDAECPVFWNSFHWNEHYWNPNKFDVSGWGLVPSLRDGSIRGFKNFKACQLGR